VPLRMTWVITTTSSSAARCGGGCPRPDRRPSQGQCGRPVLALRGQTWHWRPD
jgi:hypothetical protein